MRSIWSTTDEKESKKSKYEWKKKQISKDWVKDLENGYIKISKDYLEGSGLLEKDIIIYPRDDYKKEWNFIYNQVIKESVYGWILGLPGIGKSLAAYSLLLKLVSEGWIVTWIHLSRRKTPFYIKFKNDEKFYEQLDNDMDVKELLLLENKKSIVFLDEFYTSSHDHTNILKACDVWLHKNKINHRLVVICSMIFRENSNLDEDKRDNLKELFINSWKLEEYYKAIESKEFFDSIKKNLDSNIPLNIEDKPQDLIDSKYYYSGGSSRLMFGYKINEIISILDFAIGSVDDIVKYIEIPFSERSDVINLLFNIYKDGNKSKTSLLSQYVANQIAYLKGPQIIKNLYKSLKYQPNSSMNSWILEMSFFASIRNGGVIVNDEKKEYKWEESYLSNFDPINPKISDTPRWYNPIKWNKGGYDAVYIDKQKGLVKFVQITQSSEHSFKIQYFSQLLNKFKDIFETKLLEIYFIIHQKQFLTFKIPNHKVEGQGELELFHSDKNNKWEIEKLKIRWIQGLDE